MPDRDPAALGRLAESVIWPAIDLVGLVHGGGDHEAIGEHLAGLTAGQLRALPVILAAMVDDSQTPDQMLGWIDFDEEGRPLREPRSLTPRWRFEHRACGTEEASRRHDFLSEDCAVCQAADRARGDREAERRRAAWQAEKARKETAA